MYDKALIVDDSSLDRLITERVVKMNLFAKELVIFDSVMPALAYLGQCVEDNVAFPNIIFLDIQMPVMNGFDFLDKFTEFPEEAKKNCRVATLSASTNVEDRLHAESYDSVTRFFSKPLCTAYLAEL